MSKVLDTAYTHSFLGGHHTAALITNAGHNTHNKHIYVFFHQIVKERLTGQLANQIWWVWVDLKHRPHPYQGCALTN